MKGKFLAYVRLVFLFTFIYVILNESFRPLTVSLGVICGSLAIWLTNKILEIDYVEMFQINLWLVFMYFWLIIRDTYVEGFKVIIRMFKGDIKPNFIRYPSNLNDEFLTALLANAITMPPGTITVDREGDEMTILTIGFPDDEFCKGTYDNIEKKFKRFDSNK